MKTLHKQMVLFLLLLPFFAGAQSISVTHVQAFIANGTNNALAVNVPEANSREVSDAWKKFMKKKGATLTGLTEILAENARFDVISPDLMDVYAIFNQKEGFVEMIVAFKTGTGFIYPATSPVAYGAAEKIVKDFAMKQARDGIGQRLAGEKSELKKLSNKEKKFRKQEKKLNKQIAKYNRKIDKARKEIESIGLANEQLVKDIEAARSRVAETERKLKEIK
ncbi:MAG TPA: hypothetical protein P5228_02965 [Bacteroidales bacterium]|nr:hypothetical protein [Bacteroidales bacterium]HRZ49251.1 hypothetical protein [Bacteroidales bacterium]